MGTRRLLVFARLPVEGRVKTRLVPRLGTAGALALHRAMLGDAAALAGRLLGEGVAAELCLDGPGEDGAGMPELPRTLQGAGDLGARLIGALARGAGPTVVLGADAPTLPHDRIDDAFAALERGADAAVVPAEDGGYVLLGVARPDAAPALLREIPWGGPEVLAATRAAAARAGWRLVELLPWYDVDRPEDLVRLSADLTRPEVAARAPATAAVMLDAQRRGMV